MWRETAEKTGNDMQQESLQDLNYGLNGGLTVYALNFHSPWYWPTLTLHCNMVAVRTPVVTIILFLPCFDTHAKDYRLKKTNTSIPMKNVQPISMLLVISMAVQHGHLVVRAKNVLAVDALSCKVSFFYVVAAVGLQISSLNMLIKVNIAP